MVFADLHSTLFVSAQSFQQRQVQRYVGGVVAEAMPHDMQGYRRGSDLFQ